MLRNLRFMSSAVFQKQVSAALNAAKLTECPALSFQVTRSYSHPKTHHDVRNLTKQEWEKRLTPEQFSVCREQCTEPPFSGEYVNHYEEGVYVCVCCGATLFSSSSKYDSRTGWPSFYAAYEGEKGVTNVIERPEHSAERYTGSIRTEVICKKCDSHLGHVFEDGPPPTGKRYCINSIALQFEGEED